MFLSLINLMLQALYSFVGCVYNNEAEINRFIVQKNTMILSYINLYKTASREKIDELLLPKLSDTLNFQHKKEDY